MDIDGNNWKIDKTWREGNRIFVAAKCENCGDVVEKSRKENIIGSGKIRQCSCNKTVLGKPLSPGDRFGKLEVLSRDYDFISDKHVKWIVRCDCGIIKSLQGSQLRSGNTSSCGCSVTERRGAPREDHGKAHTKEYKTWASIKSRTDHPHKSTRKWYYDKGIGISDEWRKSFLAFLADMGECPEGYSIDRIDSTGDYSKENCRWASIELQSINKGISSNNTSGCKGVSNNKSGRYTSYIYHKRTRIHLGTFKTLEEAVNARKQAEEKYWSGINE